MYSFLLKSLLKALQLWCENYSRLLMIDQSIFVLGWENHSFRFTQPCTPRCQWSSFEDRHPPLRQWIMAAMGYDVRCHKSMQLPSSRSSLAPRCWPMNILEFDQVPELIPKARPELRVPWEFLVPWAFRCCVIVMLCSYLILTLLDSRMWETSLFQRLPVQGMFGIEVPLDPLWCILFS